MAMAEDDVQHWVTEAARTLLSLHCTPVKRWPEWHPLPSEEQLAELLEVVEVKVPQVWPKACRRRAKERPKATAAWRFGSANFGSGAPRGGVDEAHAKPMAAPESSTVPRHGGAAAGSRPSPSTRGAPRGGVDEAHAKPMAAPESSTVPRQGGAAAGSGPGPSTRGADRASEDAKAEVAALKDAKGKASSPDTPLDYAAAVAESGASSGGEDGAPRSPANRKASGIDEACSPPAKRAREDAAAAGDHATAAADKVKEEADKTRGGYRDENGCLLFDLNDDAPLEEDLIDPQGARE